MTDYRAINRAHWNSLVDAHLASDFYDLPGFKAGKSSLKPPELAAVGEVAGRSLLHLQCHFGQDTLSWARLGAEVTGMDLSEKAIAAAQGLARELDLHAHFVACDLYDLPQHLGGQFDVVFTSYGSIGWLPDLARWAEIVAHFLKPGGRFVMVEFHPVLWMFDDAFERIAYSYFNVEPIIISESGSYADRTHPQQTQEVGWNHSLGEVIGALDGVGLRLDWFEEYPYSVWPCFADMRQVGEGRWVVSPLGDKVPHMYGLRAKWR